VAEPLKNMAIYRRIQRSMLFDGGSLAARKSLIVIIFIALRLTQ